MNTKPPQKEISLGRVTVLRESPKHWLVEIRHRGNRRVSVPRSHGHLSLDNYLWVTRWFARKEGLL